MLADDNKLLENAFNVLNGVYFNSSLPRAVITIQSNPKSYGYITVRKVWTDKENMYHEINISAEHLNRPIEQVLATLMHEMVHLYALVNGIQDTSNGNRYHNKTFKRLAEERDLIIKCRQYIGWSKTSPSERFIQVLKENALYTDMQHCRKVEKVAASPTPPGSGNGNKVTTGRTKSSTRKYICEGCGISVRATKDVFIICGNCMEQMVLLE